MKTRIALASLLLLSSSATTAQEPSDGWDWKVAPYLWMTNFDGSSAIGPIVGDIDMGFDDVLDDLQFAFEMFVAADKGHHGFHLDATYLELEGDPEPARIGPGEITTDLDMTAIEGAYRYHASGSLTGHTFLLGARYIDTTVTLTPTFIPRVEAGADWTDGFVGYQYVGLLSDKWVSQFQVTAGAGGADLTLTAQLLFNRKTKSGNYWVFGARIWDFDYKETLEPGVPYKLNLTNYGLLAGFIFD